ncbi:alpha/beta fold hydrolase [Streptomyces sp. 5K101]|uniref:alpha/beta fold hydrolase n=1 Tax=Streptomyces sp. 5K101 TaxID=3390037 RepID=UPI003975BD92
MVGSADTFLPPALLGRAVERRLGIPLHVVEGAGHLLPEAPDRMAALVAGFLPSVRPRH